MRPALLLLVACSTSPPTPASPDAAPEPPPPDAFVLRDGCVRSSVVVDYWTEVSHVSQTQTLQLLVTSGNWAGMLDVHALVGTGSTAPEALTYGGAYLDTGEWMSPDSMVGVQLACTSGHWPQVAGCTYRISNNAVGGGLTMHIDGSGPLSLTGC